MSQSPDYAGQPSGQAVQVALAWIFVGIPLLWGIVETVRNALKLFQ